MHSEQQPREKAMSHGVRALTLPELWALVIGTGTRGHNVVDVCTELMQRNNNNLSALSRRSLKQLSEIKGLGPQKALQIQAVLEIGRRMQQQELPVNPSIRSANDAYDILKPEIGNLDHEEIWVLLLDRANHLIKKYQTTSGSATASIFDLKGIMKKAILENAQAMLIAHNHPSGNLTPSSSDDNITSRCKEACATMEISLLDHIIVTSVGYYSYRQ